LKYFQDNKYAIGAAKNIDANVPNITQIQIVNENVLITHVPNINIHITTNNVEIDVAIDLCKLSLILFSNTSQYTKSFEDFFVIKFSLILSKITIVSLIQYHIIVSNAMINIVSICTVSLNAIQIPYAHTGREISNTIVINTINHKLAGDI
jgi:hypothetical protein